MHLHAMILALSSHLLVAVLLVVTRLVTLVHLSLPLVRPPPLAGLWEDVSFKLYGNLFWPDFWPPGSNADAEDVVYDMVGLEAKEAAVSRRGTPEWGMPAGCNHPTRF